MKNITAKLHTMRKPQSFSALPMSNGQIIVQSDKSIGTYDPATGRGRLSVKGNTFLHLSAHGFAYEFPADFREQVAAVLPRAGESTDIGGITVLHTVKVIGQ